MGLGLNYEASPSSGNFAPWCKYDARAGRFFRKGENGDIDITNNFSAIFDLDSIDVGWINITAGGAPSLALTKLGTPMPPKPSDDHKQGFRVRLWLSKECGGGEHEFMATAKAVIGVIDALHTAFENSPERKEGKLPIVRMNGTSVRETQTPKGTTKNYAPNLEIVGWAPRPAGGAAPVTGTTVSAAPPATGSTPVPPPQREAITAADFG